MKDEITSRVREFWVRQHFSASFSSDFGFSNFEKLQKY